MSYQFNLKEIAESLHYIIKNDSSSQTLANSLDFTRANPMHLLLHNEILKLNKDDVDNFSYKNNFNKSFYQLSLSTKKSILFIPFLKIGAFENNLHYYTKWVNDNLNSFSNIDDKLDLCFQLEYSFKNKESNSLNKKFNEHTTFLDFIYNFSSVLDSKDLTKIFNEFEPNLNISQYFLNKFHTESLTSLKLFDFILKHNPKIQKKHFINEIVDCLKQPSHDAHYYSNSLSNTDFKKISHLLDYNFNFDETKSINNNNLFIFILKTKYETAIRKILPHLNNIVPPDGDWETQNSYINNLSNVLDGVNKSPDLIQFIQSIYNKNLLSLELDKIPAANTHVKIKI